MQPLTASLRSQSLANTGELDSVKGVEGEPYTATAGPRNTTTTCSAADAAPPSSWKPRFRGLGTDHGQEVPASRAQHVVEVTGYCPDCTLALREEETQNESAR